MTNQERIERLEHDIAVIEIGKERLDLLDYANIKAMKEEIRTLKKGQKS